MSVLRQAIQNYLVLRRSLGCKLEEYDRHLSDFVAYMERTGHTVITTATAMEWACSSDRLSRKTQAMRFSAVRGFAAYVRALEPRTEVPPPHILPHPKQRPAPYLYTPTEIQALMSAAQNLPVRNRTGALRPYTYATLIGLLMATGMRLGEAIRLDRSDLDQDEDLLVIRHTKFGKSREVPLHRTTVAALRTYAAKRDQIIPRPRVPTFFITERGTRLHKTNVGFCFRRLLRQIVLPDLPKHRPRIHDLRHTFAVETLIGWYRAGTDVQARLPLLSTYLGHVDPINTYWYLTGVPELVGLAAERLEQNLGGLP